MADTNDKLLSTIIIDGVEYKISDEMVQDILGIIYQNNTAISSRINDLNSRLTTLEGITPITTEEDPVFSASAAAGITQGNITAWNSYQANTIESITVNGTTQTITNKNVELSIVSELPNDYATSSLTNEDLLLESGDSFETAFSKIEKTIIDNEEVSATALNDLNSRVVTLEAVPPFVESDPIFNASAAAGITSGNIDKWNSYSNIIESITVNGTTQTPSGKNISLTIPSTTGLATTQYVDSAVAGIVNSAPETLDTLNELATALGNDPNFATTVATQIGERITKTELSQLGYLQSETDPVFTASAAHGITSGNITAWNSYQANVIESITVNGTTQTITNKNAELSIPLTLSEYYDKSNLSNEELSLAQGDSFETAFSKLEKSVSDKSIITSEALIDLNSKIITIENELHNNPSFKILSSETNVLEPGADDYYIDGNSVSDPTEAKELLEKNGWLLRDGNLYYLIKTDTTSSNYIYYYVATFDIDDQKIRIAKLNWQVSYSRFGIRDWYVFSVGGDANIINSITVNGTTQTPSNKNIALTIPSEVTESTVAGWGFTKNSGTLTSETDPVFTASAAHGITAGNISAWNSYQVNVIESITVNGTTQTITNKNAELTISDSLTTDGFETTYYDLIDNGITNDGLLLEVGDTFEEAFAKLQRSILDNEEVSSAAMINLNSRIITLENDNSDIEESDPIFSASPAATISSNDITNWNSSEANIINSITVNGTTQTPTNKNIALTIPSAVTESTVAGWGFTKNSGTLTTETDPVFTASAAHGITAGNITNWNSYQANVIESITVNGTTQTPNGKNIALTIPSTNGLATTEYVNSAVAGIVNSAPETLDTLNELATALGNDPNFATTVSNQIGTKVSKDELSQLGYLQSETDPVFTASAAHGITSGNITAWNSYQANVIEAVTFNGATATVTNKVAQITATVIPSYSSADAGKILSINASGQLVWISPVSIYSGTDAPNNSQGNNGDIYLQV